MKRRIVAGLIFISLSWSAGAQEPFEGYTLFNVLNSTTCKLIDIDGNIENFWNCTCTPGCIPYLLRDSTLLRPGRASSPSMESGGTGGRIQLIAWNGTVLWDYLWSNQNHQQHHDVQPMPNGNVLLIAWERKTEAEAIAMGRESISGDIWPTEIVEVNPATDSVVWEWHIWDHLIQDVDSLKPNYGVVADHPELMDINYGRLPPPTDNGDWIHANAVDYNEALDQIIFSSHSTDEFYVIDHSTTTEEAAGHTGGNGGKGGDFLYRWGNPLAYGRGGASDQHFHVLHGVNWIDPGLPGEGNILVFNNGDRSGTSNDYSSTEEIVPPLDGYNYYIATDSAFGPQEPTWIYSDPGTFYSNHLSGMSRLPNGNTLICEGTSGYLFEVTTSGEKVWNYNCGGQMENALRYGLDYFNVEENSSQMPREFALEQISPNPFAYSTTITYHLSASARVSLRIHDVSGRVVRTLVNGQKEAGSHSVTWNATGLSKGLYFARLTFGENLGDTRKLVLTR
jgi:hypothetical protein